jgi:hypothetical protein
MPGSNNFQQWNPSQINQESDVAYTSDAQRVGGAPNGVAFPSQTGNKLFYQVSTFVTAFCQMMATKGYNVVDTNIATLASVLAAVRTTADLVSGLDSISYSSSITCDASSFAGFEISLAGNTTLTVTGVAAGQSLIFIFVQDSAGGHIVTWPGTFYGGLQPDPTPNSVSVIVFDIDAGLNGRAASPVISNNGTFATGGLICPTRSPGDNTTNAATTAFVGAAITGSFTLGSNSNGAWVKDPTGELTQRNGNVSLGGGDFAVTFPIAFANTINLSVVVTVVYPSGDTGFLTVNSITTSGFNIHQNDLTGMSANWIAIGNGS